jgi:hypothetical protein
MAGTLVRRTVAAMLFFAKLIISTDSLTGVSLALHAIALWHTKL